MSTVEVSLTCEAERDPYSALWSRVTPEEQGSIRAEVEGNPAWNRSASHADLRVQDFHLCIQNDWEILEVYVATSREAVDVLCDILEDRLLRRGPDSVS